MIGGEPQRGEPILLIYLVRHAIAEDRELRADLPDEERRLTDKGMRRMRRAVEGLAAMEVEVDTIWTSPLRRAKETAELLAELPTFDGDIKEVRDLEPGGDLNGVIKRLIGVGNGLRVALVGHEPDMSMLMMRLIGGAEEDGVRFKKGAVACLEFDGDRAPPRAELQWFIAPKQLRQIA